MAFDVKPKYAAAVVALTVTNLHNLADGSYWQSAVQDNTTNLYLDSHLQLTLVTANSGSSAGDKGFTIYAYASVDGGTTYTEGASGSEGSFTAGTDRQLAFVGFVPHTVINATVKSKAFSIAAAFGGVLPQKWGIVIYNKSGFPLAASANVVQHLPLWVSSP